MGLPLKLSLQIIIKEVLLIEVLSLLLNLILLLSLLLLHKDWIEVVKEGLLTHI